MTPQKGYHSLGKKKQEEPQKIYSLRNDEKQATEMFSFVNEDVYQFSYCPQTGMLGIVSRTKKPLKEGEPEPKFDKPKYYNYKLTLYNAEGKVLLTRDDIQRVNIHPYGRYIILETNAAPIPSVAPSKLIYVSDEERHEMSFMRKEVRLPNSWTKNYSSRNSNFGYQEKEIWRIILLWSTCTMVYRKGLLYIFILRELIREHYIRTSHLLT